MASDEQLSPNEVEILHRLTEIARASDNIQLQLQQYDQALNQKNAEITELRSRLAGLQEENQRLRETLQTWRDRLNGVLSQLKGLN